MSARTDVSAAMEDYLEAIFHLVVEKQVARARDIAEGLKVSRSSVTGALQSLAEKGLVNYEPYEVITLTRKGKKIADVPGPDGMSVDVKCRLYVTSADGVSVFAADGKTAKDFVSVDFACLSCHNNRDAQWAKDKAKGIHSK